MTKRQLLLRNLLHFWRTNLAVLLGVITATAVVGGALVVGDSVRDSLKEMSLERLGRIDHAVHGQRFFRDDLAEELQSTAENVEVVAPAIIVQGTVEQQQADRLVSRAGGINVYGLDQAAWSLLETGSLSPPQQGQIVLNERAAEQLHAELGSQLSLIVEIPPSIPRDSLLGDRNQTVTELVLTVSGIASDQTGLARLGLNPTQQLPLNVYVSLDELQSQLGLSAVERSRRNPIAHPARVNTLFISTTGQQLPDDALLAASQARKLTQILTEHLTLEDVSLRLVSYDEKGYVSLESEQLFLEKPFATAAHEAGQELHATLSPVLVYLINEIWKPETPDKYSMYSVIAGVDPTEQPPFGPFSFQGDHLPLEGNRVYLNDWVAEDLGASTGDTVRVKYHVVGDRGELPELEHEFEVAGVVELSGPADDQHYTPTVPGVTDAETYDDWREPFPLKRSRITGRDDEYWEEYRTTPKVFVSLEQAKDLWSSRYGDVSIIRFAPTEGQSLSELQKQLPKAILSHLSAGELGMPVQPVKLVGLNAASGTTDFTGLFLSFSFFLILSATILVGLLFRLGIERRLDEVGLLRAVGLTTGQVRRLLLAEGMLLVVVGGLIGLAAAVGYAQLMIYGLKTWWYGAIGTRFLFVSVHPLSLLIGWLSAVVVAAIAVWWAIARTRKQSVRSLLAGAVSASSIKKPWLARVLAIGGLGGSLLLLVVTLTGVIPDQEAFSGFSWQVVAFFLTGVGLLTGLLSLLSVMLASRQAVSVRGVGQSAQWRLGLRNAARNRTRSVMTASLLASATFVIVAVAAGQMNPLGDRPDPRSGNGGFRLVAQTNVPILYDLNTAAGRAKLGFDTSNPSQQAALDAMTVYPLRMKPGENASCLNLYQTQLPTVLGVPEEVLQDFQQKNRFLFANTPSDAPWSLIKPSKEDAPIPVLGDMNTLTYSMHKAIGDVIAIPDAENPEFQLRIAGMFANSVFQGVLVMSETNFLKVFPDQAGFQYFLIEVDKEHADAVSQILESELGDYGFDVERVSQRLADFLAVQNTYLSTFQTLGGLGLLLGTLGLATVMLRNVLERAGEFALLRAVGFQRTQIAGLVAWENACLLLAGLVAGTISALLAMLPHLMTTAANVAWGGLLGMLLGVFVLGMLAAIVAVRAAVALPILATLRGD